MKKILMIMTLSVALQGSSPALCDGGSGGTASPFALGVGGRHIAIGGSAAAVWGGSCALVWNPAGLESLDRAEISLFHTPLFDEEASYYSALGAYPFLDMGTMAFGVQQLGIDGIERRDSDNLISGNELSCRQTRYLVGYSRRIYGPLTGGVTLKLDRFVQGSYSANGFGADIGIGYERAFESSFVEGGSLGLTVFNILEPTMKLVEEKSGDPRGLRTGVAVWGPVSGKLDDRLMLALDLEDTRYSELKIHAGLEYAIGPYAAVRGGYDDGFPTFGLGFRISGICLDYAFRTSDLESYHLFSLSVGFGPTRSKRIENRQAARELELRLQIDREISNYEGKFVENSILEAEEALSNGRFVEAEMLFDKVMLMDPENEKARKGRIEAEMSRRTTSADSLFERGDHAGALLIYRGIPASSAGAKVAAKIESCEMMIAQVEDQREMIERIFERGLEYFSDRKWRNAVGAFEQVLVLAPGHNLAGSYLEKTHSRIEEERHRNLLRIDDLISTGRYGKAVEMIRAGTERYGNDPDFESRLARARLLQADAEKKKHGIVAVKHVPGTKLSREELEKVRHQYEKGVARFKDGQFDQAVEEWEAAWEKYPDYENLTDYLVKAYQYWGMELYTKHRYEEALEVWERILRVDNENEKALRYIGRTKEELGRLESLTG